MQFTNTKGGEYEISISPTTCEIEICHDQGGRMGVAAYCKYAGAPWEEPYIRAMERKIRGALGEREGVIKIELDDLVTVPQNVEGARALWAYLIEIGRLEDGATPQWYCIQFRLFSFLKPMYWVGEDWTDDAKNAMIYLNSSALPKEIDSVEYQYVLTRKDERYEPPKEYWREFEDFSVGWPHERLTDQYRNTRYRAVLIEDEEEMMELLSPDGGEKLVSFEKNL